MDKKEIRETSPQSPDLKSLRNTVILRFALAFLVLGLVFFLPAGTFGYWPAWVYLLVLFVPMLFLGLYLFRYDPKLLERRMRTRERRTEQKLVIMLGWLFFVPAYILPGLDWRFGWSHVPLPLVIVSDVIVLSGYLLFALVLRANSYASRIVEVEKSQKVISTGPYRVVRHPMYLATLILLGFTPLALASYWAMVPFPLWVAMLVVRIKGEEKELIENLEGYKEYMLKTRCRLVPGVW